MLPRKLLLFALALQISTATLPLTSQDTSVNTDQKNEFSKETHREIDPGLTLLLSVVGISLGGFLTCIGFASTGAAGFKAFEVHSNTEKAAFGTLMLPGLGVTYLGAKMTWFYLKRGGKVLFHKD